MDNAPWITGAAAVMDCADLRDACAGLGVDLPLRHVLDVGCGTGRFARCCDEYAGVDISADQVAYAQRHLLNVSRISGPVDLMGAADGILKFTWVVCFSVFTHIARTGRVAYLAAFRTCADNLIVDVIPGDGGGDVALWTADWPTFLKDLDRTGWRVEAGPYDRTSPDGVTHRYVRARR